MEPNTAFLLLLCDVISAAAAGASEEIRRQVRAGTSKPEPANGAEQLSLVPSVPDDPPERVARGARGKRQIRRTIRTGLTIKAGELERLYTGNGYVTIAKDLDVGELHPVDHFGTTRWLVWLTEGEREQVAAIHYAKQHTTKGIRDGRP